MHLGLALSMLMHAALLGWALFTIQSTAELKPPAEKPIEVALISASELLRLKQGSLTATELEAKAKETSKTEQSVKEAEKPKPVTGEIEPPPPPPPEPAKPEPPKPDPIAEKLAEAPPPEPAPPPPPGPTPEEKAALEAKIEAERKAEEKRVAEQKERERKEKERKEKERKEREAKLKKEREEKLRKRMAELADKALLDKDPTKRGAANASDPPSKPTDYTGPTAGANQGNDTVLSATEAALLASQLRAQIKSCWKLPGGGGGTDIPVVTLTWRLRPDGSLEGEPQVMNPRSDQLFQIASETAVRAVKACSPFDLPKDKYEFWKLIEAWEFDPRQML
jgi:colicin import membrane protein